MATAKQIVDPKDPAASASSSEELRSEQEQRASTCFGEDGETTATSLIENWIDA